MQEQDRHLPVQTDTAAEVAAVQPQRLRFEFYGNASEYFKIWLVNLCLTIVTLSFYAPWAKVRNLRYFYGNTALAGGRFDFTAQPSRILIGRLIATAVFAAVSVLSQLDPAYALAVWGVFVLLMPWLVRSTMRFRARNSKYGNARFHFSASLGATYWLFIKCLLVTLLSFGLLYPLALYWFKSYQINHLRAGHLPFRLWAGVGSYYKAVILPYLLGILALALVVGLAGLAGGVGGAWQNAHPETAVMLLSVALSAVYVLMLGFFVPLTQGYLFRATWESAGVGRSWITTDLNPYRYAWIKFSNYVLTVATLGLMRPWSLVRLYRYQAASLQVELKDDPQDLLNIAQDDPNSIGEELSDVFDIDISL
ncbi:YjgN family protein [Bergeriella denitrificans]|uniref:Inner membrane protein yjgN n=1 Tax=Bergeriella denitrificans TaxID=494 RepID=A0A378UEU1_BERDE|nr:YjgN family protein [Bergeriella denitrificans]STZ75928.1 Inner membrane protein yjgN [Bergeriella denitrificans]